MRCDRNQSQSKIWSTSMHPAEYHGNRLHGKIVQAMTVDKIHEEVAQQRGKDLETARMFSHQYRY